MKCPVFLLEIRISLCLPFCHLNIYIYRFLFPDLNKSKMKVPEAPTVKSGYLEGGASGRLPRIMDEDVAAKSNRWWNWQKTGLYEFHYSAVEAVLPD